MMKVEVPTFKSHNGKLFATEAEALWEDAIYLMGKRKSNVFGSCLDGSEVQWVLRALKEDANLVSELIEIAKVIG